MPIGELERGSLVNSSAVYNEVLEIAHQTGTWERYDVDVNVSNKLFI